MGKFIDLTGQRFGWLTVIERVASHGRRVLWLCICDCGNLVKARSDGLKVGGTVSCGCFHREDMHVNPRRLRHGATVRNKTTPEYMAYANAKQRCNNLARAEWVNYGGRGIEFRFASFEEFFAELGKRPLGTSLDRINNNGHYEPGNVRWATPEEQANNKRPYRRRKGNK